MKKILFTVLSVIFVLSMTLINVNADNQGLMMATTTSTDNTGLLDYLIPHFEKETGINLKWTATGTGKALKLGQKCDVDVLLVHAPPAEKKYIANGYGKERREIMYNDFVIIGPENDPANIKGKNISDALKLIKTKQALFASSLVVAVMIPVPIKKKNYCGKMQESNCLIKKNGISRQARACLQPSMSARRKMVIP